MLPCRRKARTPHPALQLLTPRCPSSSSGTACCPWLCGGFCLSKRGPGGGTCSWLFLLAWLTKALNKLPPGRCAVTIFILQHPGPGPQGGAAGAHVFLLLRRGGVSRELRLIAVHFSVFLAFPCETPQSIAQHTAVLHPREIAVTRFKSQMAVD